MARETRFHIDEMPEGVDSPKHLTKQQFGQRVYKAMLEHGWNQSELARQADLPRDSISVYIRGRSLPTPLNLQKLSKALGMKPADLLPNSVESAIDNDFPSIEIRVSTSSPDMAWVRINRLMPFETASQIVSLLKDIADDRETPDAK